MVAEGSFGVSESGIGAYHSESWQLQVSLRFWSHAELEGNDQWQSLLQSTALFTKLGGDTGDVLPGYYNTTITLRFIISDSESSCLGRISYKLLYTSCRPRFEYAERVFSGVLLVLLPVS
jgi:hypothetical protein